MLEVFRRLLHDRLVEAEEYQRNTQDFVDYYTAWLQDLDPSMYSMIHENELQKIDAEIANLRHAYRFILSAEMPSPAQLDVWFARMYHFFESRARFVEGLEFFERGIEYLDSHEPDSGELRLVQAKCLVRLGSIQISLGRVSDAGEHLERGSALLAELDNPHESAFAAWQSGRRHYYDNKPVLAKQDLLRAVDAFRSLENETFKANALIQLGMVENALGEYVLASEYLERGLAIHERLEIPYLQALAMNNLANTLCELGEFESALDYYNQCLQVHRNLRNSYRIALVLNNIATVYIVLKNFDQARPLLEESVKICVDIGDHQGKGVALINLGYLNYLAGSLEAGREFIEQGLEVFKTVDYAYMELLGRIVYGHILVRLGEIDKALSIYLSVIRRAEQGGIKPFVLRALAGIAKVHAIQGRQLKALGMARFIAEQSESNLETREEALLLAGEIEEALANDGLQIPELESARINLEDLVREALALQKTA
jgi:tetratricopeptide (TPR) repeat protein